MNYNLNYGPTQRNIIDNNKIVTVSDYSKRTNIQIAILTTLVRRNALAYGTFGGLSASLKQRFNVEVLLIVITPR